MRLIQKLGRKELDWERWDNMVSESSSLPYSLSWYMDVVTDGQWEALIYKDYEAALPVPFNTKILGYKQAYRPVFCQQFHVLGADVPPAVTQWLLQYLETHYHRVNFPLAIRSRESLSDTGMDIRECTDLVIPLNRTYAEVSANYSKSLRKRLRKSDNLQILEGNDVRGTVEFYKREVGSKSGLSTDDFDKAKSLFMKCQERGLLKLYEVMDDLNQLNAMGMFLDYNGRLINIFGASNAIGRENNAMHAVIDHFIKRSCQTHNYFDFEGSDVLGVREFFQSFGPEYRAYYTLSSNNLPLPVKLLFNLYDRRRG